MFQECTLAVIWLSSPGHKPPPVIRCCGMSSKKRDGLFTVLLPLRLKLKNYMLPVPLMMDGKLLSLGYLPLQLVLKLIRKKSFLDDKIKATLLRAIFNISGKGIVTAPKALATNDAITKLPPNSNKIKISRLLRLSLISIHFHPKQLIDIKNPLVCRTRGFQ